MQDSLVSSVHDIPSLVRMQRQFEHEGNRLGSIYALKEWGRALRNESRFEEALHIHSEGLRQAETLRANDRGHRRALWVRARL